MIEGKEVVIFLNTPLVPNANEPAFKNPIVRLEGKILSDDHHGLVVHLKSLYNQKGLLEKPLEHKKIFLPMHKIDYVGLE